MWFKVDDSFHSHPKSTAASLEALGLWTVCGSWSGDHLTDGFVPDHMIRILARGQAQLADELVAAGLWRRTKGGYRFHQWDERNPTKSVAIASAEKKASGGALGNHLRWHVKGGVQKSDCQFCQEKEASGKRSGKRSDTDRSSESGPNPDPTRPEGSTTYSINGGFDEIWKTLPRRRGDSKHKAELAYDAAIKRGVAHDVILDHATAYASERRGQDQQYTKGGQTWFNTRPWDNGAPEQPRPRSIWDN